MARTWFTADLHLGHANIIKYCQRPFLNEAERERARQDPRGPWRVSRETVERHDESLLRAINDVVGAEDVLWVLGDFCWGELGIARKYIDRIVCRDVRLVWGNHDHPSVGQAFNQAIEQGLIFVDRQPIFLNHYPMRSWNRAFHGAWHLYGHVHGKLSAEDEAQEWMLTRDIGVDACDYRPWSFEEVRGYMRPRLEQFEARKRAMIAGQDELLM